ncbi:MAG: DUF4249 domain-containing protein [Prolixibacteraceae bacterium]|jgi:hypothetical protein|nr:DUF4249 domain-containing protein [Prolixibacteraceae bacterium]
MRRAYPFHTPVGHGFTKIRTLTLYRILAGVVAYVALILSFGSCEKVIQLDLKKSTPKIVIQGNIYDQPGPYIVKISNSVNFDASSNYPPVTGAAITISDNSGQNEKLTETTAGTYLTSKLRGVPGRTYSLSVKIGNENYLSTATMPLAVPIDSIYFSSSLFSGEKMTTVRILDPPFIVNYYRLVYFINKVRQKAFYVLDDDLFQGAIIRYALLSRGSNIKLVKGDLVTVWLESIDHGVFEYFRTAGSDGGESASPANPVSNISNGALGYFNACAVRKISANVSQ